MKQTSYIKDAKKYNLINNIKYVMCLVCKWDKKIIIILTVAVFFNAIFPYMYPVMSRQVINCISNEKGYMELVGVTLRFGVIFLLLKIIYARLNLSLWWRFFYLKNKFVIQKMEKVMEIPFNELENKNVLDMAEKAEKSTQGTNGAEGMLYSGKTAMICIIRIVLSAVVMSVMSPIIVIAALALSLINFRIMSGTKKADMDILYVQKAPVDRRCGYWTGISYNRDFAKEVRIFNLKEWVLEKLRTQNKKALKLLKASKKNLMNAALINNMISLAQKGIVYGYVIRGVYFEKISIADFVFYTGCIMVLFDTISELLDNFSTINRQSAEVAEYRRFMDYWNEVENGKHIEHEDNVNIEFKNVYFRYEGQNEWAVEDLNLSLRRGEKTAVTGKNGSGKSTLIKLLCRLYEPVKGEILLNGINIKNYDRNDYYKLIAPVFQEVIVFAMSLRENIAFVKTGHEDMARVLNSIEKSGLKERVDIMKNGLNSELLRIMDDDGEELSGGEKQKTAVARSLYKNSVTNIWDEPTSAMDPTAERKLYESMDELMKNRIGAVVSHRLSYAKFCDQIIYMESGKILERGSHSQLMEKDGGYGKLYKLQAQYYVD